MASLGLAYGMYFNVTRYPEVEAELKAVRDLLFDKYDDPVGNRGKDALSADLSRRWTSVPTEETSPTCSSPAPPCSCPTPSC